MKFRIQNDELFHVKQKQFLIPNSLLTPHSPSIPFEFHRTIVSYPSFAYQGPTPV